MNPKIKPLLRELAKTRHLFWNITPETGLFLNQLIRTINAKKVLEIGTSNGYSAIWMAEALQDTGGHLYTIESHKKHRHKEAQKNFAKAGKAISNRITLILGHAPEVIPSSPSTFDLIFLDATKYEHEDYLKAILPRTHKGSIIITDNALSHKKDLKPYRKAANKHPKLQTSLLNIGTGLLISIKT
jgi:predicted O-methyltransferase YrrM